MQSLGTINGSEQDTLLRALPSRWEKLGDMVLLPATAFTECEWAALAKEELWSAVASGLGARRLGRQASIASTGTRSVPPIQMDSGGFPLTCIYRHQGWAGVRGVIFKT